MGARDHRVRVVNNDAMVRPGAYETLLGKQWTEWLAQFPLPFLLNENAAAEILESLGKGVSIPTALAVARISRGDFDLACERVIEFKAAVDYALAKPKHRAAEVVYKGIDEDEDTKLAVRFLEAHEPDAWTPQSKTKHDISGLSDEELIRRTAGALEGDGGAGADAPEAV